jgi:hypothetical protein
MRAAIKPSIALILFRHDRRRERYHQARRSRKRTASCRQDMLFGPGPWHELVDLHRPAIDGDVGHISLSDDAVIDVEANHSAKSVLGSRTVWSGTSRLSSRNRLRNCLHNKSTGS